MRALLIVALLCASVGCSQIGRDAEDATIVLPDDGNTPCSLCSDSDAAPADSADVELITTPGDVYVIGTNIAGKATADAFMPAGPGMPVNVVLGPQTAWMLVVAARTDMFDCCVDRVDVETELRGTDGTLFGQLRYRRRPLLDGGDGYRYLMNVFLVVGNPDDWNGKEADLTVSITPHEGGETLADTARVTLQMDP